MALRIKIDACVWTKKWVAVSYKHLWAYLVGEIAKKNYVIKIE